LKVFIGALTILAVLIGATAANAVFSLRRFETICLKLEALSDEAGEENAAYLDGIYRLFQKDRHFFNISYKRNELEQLQRLLSDARQCCLTGDSPGYRSAKEGAVIMVARFRDLERLTAENIF